MKKLIPISAQIVRNVNFESRSPIERQAKKVALRNAGLQSTKPANRPLIGRSRLMFGILTRTKAMEEGQILCRSARGIRLHNRKQERPAVASGGKGEDQ